MRPPRHFWLKTTLVAVAVLVPFGTFIVVGIVATRQWWTSGTGAPAWRRARVGTEVAPSPEIPYRLDLARAARIWL